jgi:selenium-binding protein 1
MDCETFEILGRYEMDRGKQDKHYDFWWNLPRDYMVSSEWGLPPQFENGIVAEDLLSNKYGHSIHFWNLRERKQRADHRPWRQPPDGAGNPARA